MLDFLDFILKMLGKSTGERRKYGKARQALRLLR